ncbi:MAG: hypothetical protein R3A46_15530 [Thermomicrobiales bacterium]
MRRSQRRCSTVTAASRISISHTGIGLNPALHTEVDWVLVDEHRHGSLFIAFGENRYLGGQNASSLQHRLRHAVRHRHL